VESCDVLIVGGGPAGSSVARGLRRHGLDALVLDRARFPRDKVCAGWITLAVVEALQLDLGDYGKRNLLQPIHAFGIGTIGGRQVRTRRSATPVSFGIRRCEFDHYLLRRSGARLRLGESLVELKREGSGWLVNGSIRTPLVVGAGGHFCPIARELGARPGPGEPAVLAQEIEFEMSPAQSSGCRVESTVPELWFCRDLKGYGWALRKGDFLNVGLGRQDGRGLAGHVEAFRRRLVADGKVPAELPPKFRGHAYLLYPGGSRVEYGDGLLLVGDAAGLAYAASGEGIGPAVESGLMAAETIAAARGDYRREKLAAYRNRLERRFGPRRRRAPALALPAGLQRYVARKLLAREWFARRVVVERWFLHARQPAPVSSTP
jgi:flavin-dependent dehydrogenase